MSDKKTCEDTSLPLWRRLHRLMRSNAASADPFAGIDTARMDLGYEAAYAPFLSGAGLTDGGSPEDRGAG
jgi:hypothetical protein